MSLIIPIIHFVFQLYMVLNLSHQVPKVEIPFLFTLRSRLSTFLDFLLGWIYQNSMLCIHSYVPISQQNENTRRHISRFSNVPAAKEITISALKTLSFVDVSSLRTTCMSMFHHEADLH